MNKLIWTKKDSVGNSTLDYDHQIIALLFNKLIDCNNQSTPSFIVNDTLCELISYMHHHIEYEETLLEELNYPDILQHRKEHLNFTDQAIKISLEDSNFVYQVSAKFLIFFKNWWYNHIINVDLKYKSFLEQKLK